MKTSCSTTIVAVLLSFLAVPAVPAQSIGDRVLENHRWNLPQTDMRLPTIVAVTGCSGVSLDSSRIPTRQTEVTVSIQDLGSLGEFIAALATLATLAYLAVQIRKNTIAVRAGSHQAVSDCFIELNSWIAKDASLARIYRIGAENLSDLNQDERAQFNFMLLSVFHAYQTTFYHHEVGTLDDALYQAIMRDIAVVLASPGVREWWTETPFSFNPEFRRYLESMAVNTPTAAV